MRMTFEYHISISNVGDKFLSIRILMYSIYTQPITSSKNIKMNNKSKDEHIIMIFIIQCAHKYIFGEIMIIYMS